MKAAIARRNQIQAWERKLKRLKEQDGLKVQPRSKRRLASNPSLTQQESLLLRQLQQQLQTLMKGLSRVEEKLNQLKAKGGY